MPTPYYSLRLRVEERLLRGKNNPHIPHPAPQVPVVIGERNFMSFTNPSSCRAPKASTRSKGMRASARRLPNRPRAACQKALCTKSSVHHWRQRFSVRRFRPEAPPATAPSAAQLAHASWLKPAPPRHPHKLSGPENAPRAASCAFGNHPANSKNCDASPMLDLPRGLPGVVPSDAANLRNVHIPGTLPRKQNPHRLVPKMRITFFLG